MPLNHAKFRSAGIGKQFDCSGLKLIPLKIQKNGVPSNDAKKDD